MSNYLSKALNPRTHNLEQVHMWDNWFRQYEYGVRFSDGNVYPANHVLVFHPNDSENNDVIRVSYQNQQATFLRDAQGSFQYGLGDSSGFAGNTLEKACESFKKAVDRQMRNVGEVV